VPRQAYPSPPFTIERRPQRYAEESRGEKKLNFVMELCWLALTLITFLAFLAPPIVDLLNLLGVFDPPSWCSMVTC
jgi:hypothetical protein